MAKTNQIGVRFDLELWETFDKMGLTTAQKKLNFLESWYVDNLEKVVAFNNQPEKRSEIEKERNPKQLIEKVAQIVNQPPMVEINDLSQRPIKMDGESGFDYGIRVSQWKKSLNK